MLIHVSDTGKQSEKQLQSLMYRVDDNVVILKRLVSEAVASWNAKLEVAGTRRQSGGGGSGGTRKPVQPAPESDGYITEDTASESQLEDVSPVSADYNAVDAIAAIQAELQEQQQQQQSVEGSDSEMPEAVSAAVANPEDILVIQGERMRFVVEMWLYWFLEKSIFCAAQNELNFLSTMSS